MQQELSPIRVEFSTLALYVGLIIGAYTWGILADLIGRRLSFNVRFVFLCSFRVFDSDEISLQITLFIAGVFGIAAGGAPNFVAYAALVACLGFGTGGK